MKQGEEEIMCVDEIPYYKKRNEKIEKKVSETGQWKELPEKYVKDLNLHDFILDELPPEEERTQKIVEIWIKKYISEWNI